MMLQSVHIVIGKRKVESGPGSLRQPHNKSLNADPKSGAFL